MTYRLGITVDYDRDVRLTEQSKVLLAKYYLKPEEASPQDGFARAAVAFSNDDFGLAQRIYDYVSMGWGMYSSPILSNAPLPGEKTRGLPISCFLADVPDSLEGLIAHTSELRWLSVMGGGVGGHWSGVRAISEIAPGPIPFLHTVDADMQAYKQGKTRKGAYAAYLDVSHPDIEEFLNIRVPSSGGDSNRKAFNIHNAVNISDAFMHAVEANAPWNLVDPKTHEIRKTISARKLWEEILTIRYRTGEPFLCFTDTANRSLPKSLSVQGLKINGSNLCTEIFLPTSAERTAVCCLSSINLRYYDEFKNTNIVEDFVVYLDNVLQYFIDHAPESIQRAKYSAQRERSLGLGTFGFHSYLQTKRLALSDQQAATANLEIFEWMNRKAVAASQQLAVERGPYPDFVEFDGEIEKRNAHLLAIAPNANSASIAGSSPSIEFWNSNAFVHETRAGSHLVKNPELEQLLVELGQNTDAVWESIILNRGSVQHLEFLSAHEKDVFKTAIEIDAMYAIQFAADRQPFICQGQSVNLFFDSNTDRRRLNEVHLQAWKRGLKSLYYLRTKKSANLENVQSKVTRVALKEEPITTEAAADECTACHA